MYKPLFTILLLGLLAGAGLGCSGNESPRPEPPADVSYIFTDALGETRQISSPQRVVALMGGLAETWLLAGGELVGATDDAWEERGLPLAPETAVVGKFNQPNVEAILTLNPDLVILSSETPAQVALNDLLAEAGIPVAYFRVTHFADYLEMLHVCTEITGRADLYTQNGSAVAEQIAAQLAEPPLEPPPSVLLLITYSGGAAVQNSATMTGKMLADLGCVNLADRNPSLLKEYSVEQVIAEDPDYILVIPMGNDAALAEKNLRESLEENPAWAELPAVQNGHYFLLPKELFLYKPNARWGDSYQYLAALFHDQ
jgi:iron complex transport system substrate-binding protein